MSYIGSLVTGATGVNAERIPSSYIPSNYTISGNTVKDHFEGLDNLIAKSSSFTGNKEIFSLDGTDISNGYIDLSEVAINESIILFVSGSTILGETDAYTVNYTGGASGNTRITFSSPLLSVLQTGDTIYTQYLYRNGLNFQASPHAETHIKDGSDQISGNSLFVDYSATNYSQTGDTLQSQLEAIDSQLLIAQKQVVEVVTITGTTYTIQNDDGGKYFRFTNSSAIGVTFPTGYTGNIGEVITFRQAGLGDITLSGATTLNGTTVSSGQDSELQTTYVATDIWDSRGG